MSKYQHLSEHIQTLTRYLEQTIEENDGLHILEILDRISTYAKRADQGDQGAQKELVTMLSIMSDDLVIIVGRCFSHLLNFINTTEQHQLASHHISNEEDDFDERSFVALLQRLKEHGMTFSQVQPVLQKLFIEIVLTAHPTEATRRSIIQKHNALDACLKELERPDLSAEAAQEAHDRLRQLITMTWVTDEVRSIRPTPVEEASWVMNTIEDSLWKAVPRFVKSLNRACLGVFGQQLDAGFQPVRVSSWTGGDRDGNGFVTHEVTKTVINTGRVRFAQLVAEDLKNLSQELTNRTADPEFCAKYGVDYEPYRYVLRDLRKRARATAGFFEQLTLDYQTAHEQALAAQAQQKISHADSQAKQALQAEQDAQLADISNTVSKSYLAATKNLLMDDQALLEPLNDIYQSLVRCRQKHVADGKLLDLIYRVRSFGVTLFRLDIRQESSLHEQAVAELVDFYGYGNYREWSEEQKLEFLERELVSRRPLLSKFWQPTPMTREVLATIKLIAQQPKGVINCYIISMARSASDVLEVKLLMKLYDEANNIGIVPLFETLTDLENATSVMERLFTNPYYFNSIKQAAGAEGKGKQMVMVGYSDSAKDAGFFAAGWAQYRAQEELVKLCAAYDVELTLFHGRGGTIGRGGSPAHAALLSQPPGSLEQGLRVTEQGEMIRFKYGLPEIALHTLDLYASAILEGNLLPPTEPKQEWREAMRFLAARSCDEYREVVFKNPEFIPYFRQATPELELSSLNLGSRAARRNTSGGVETLRAIPWIFAWTQNRLLLPTWLGTGPALQAYMDEHGRDVIVDMLKNWPFFSTRIGMLEMVFSKVNTSISADYEASLVEPKFHAIGADLRQRALACEQVILSLHGDNEHHLMKDSPWIAASIRKRNTYTLPLHLLQIELLRRTRRATAAGKEVDARIVKALMITITGVAAGMRNTG